MSAETQKPSALAAFAAFCLSLGMAMIWLFVFLVVGFIAYALMR